MAGLTSLCLGSYYVLDPLSDNSAIERDYEQMLRPLLSLMCSSPSVSFSLYLSGEALEWIGRSHPEFLSVAAELVSKKTLELIGGGFFAPYLPFIPAGDRVMQIEMLTAAIRKATGKRPRGAWLPSSAWDSSIIPALAGCGIEYVFIDAIMLESSGAEGLFPVSLEENGKAIAAIPLVTFAEIQAPQNEASPRQFLESLLGQANSAGAAFSLFIKPEAMPQVLSGKSPWLLRLFSLADGAAFSFGTASQIARGSRSSRKWIILPAGMSPAEVSCNPELSPSAMDKKALARVSVKQSVMNSYPFMLDLYAKMIYVHALVNQVRGDKARKTSAREELCRAESYLHFSRKDARLAADSAAYAYKRLLSAEKLARQRGVFSDSLAAFDYDFDGQKEYFSQTECMNMYLHSLGGKIFKCDIFSAGRNFCAFSGNSCTSSSEGFFVDYFISKEEAAALSKQGGSSVREIFSSNFYQEDFARIARKEVALKTRGIFGKFDQAVSLKKRFLFKKASLQVQFILKNESPMNLSGVFVTALNFVLSIPKKAQAEISVFSCEAKSIAPEGASEYPQTEWILISDSDGGAEFKIDANENPRAVFLFSGGGASRESPLSERGQSLNVFLCWQADLSPGYETEKTVFLTVMP